MISWIYINQKGVLLKTKSQIIDLQYAETRKLNWPDADSAENFFFR
jgi:hypothetical protein